MGTLWAPPLLLAKSEASAERKITEIPIDLQCKFIIVPAVFNLRRLPALGNGAIRQEHEQGASHRLVTERLFL